MPSFFTDFLPLILGSAIVPMQIIFTALLLGSPERGVLKGILFIAGMTTVRLIQGFVFGFIMVGVSNTSDSSKHNAITSTLLLVIGIMLLITAYRQWRHEDDPDAPPPKWLTMIETITPVKAFGVGFALVAIAPKLWVFTLNAIAVIGEAQLGRPDSITAFLVFVLLAQSLILLLILMRIIVPGQATKVLNGLTDWLTKHNRVLMITISLVFGLYFLVKAINRFLA